MDSTFQNSNDRENGETNKYGGEVDCAVLYLSLYDIIIYRHHAYEEKILFAEGKICQFI